MRAVVLREVGAALSVEDVPEPDPSGGLTPVHVRAAGVNFLDVLIRQGRYPQLPELPYVPGVELAGETEEGERVIGLVRHSGGAFAERCAVDEEWLFPLPDGADFSEGAAFLMAFLTAWIPLRGTSIEPGTRVLVTAAGGGVGSAAVQAARRLGAEVVAAASSEEKRELARSLGAAEAVGYEELESLDAVDVVLDPVGGEVFDRCLLLLRPFGTAIAVGYAGGQWRPVDPALLVGRNIGVHGFYLGRLMRLEPELVRGAAYELLGLWADGALRPVVGAEFPLERAEDAYRLIEERRHTGKVVLVP